MLLFTKLRGVVTVWALAVSTSCLTSRTSFHTWLMCTADTWAEHTEEWLGELGKDLQGPMDSCCFFLVATIFWATSGHRDKTQQREASAQIGREKQGLMGIPGSCHSCIHSKLHPDT